MLVVWGNELLSERFSSEANFCFYTFSTTSYLSSIGRASPFLVKGKTNSFYGRWFLFGDWLQGKTIFCFSDSFVQKTLQQSDSCCCVPSDSQLLSKLYGKNLFLFSAQKLIFNLRNKNYHSKRTWNTFLMSEVDGNFTTTRQIFNQKFCNRVTFETNIYNASNQKQMFFRKNLILN